MTRNDRFESELRVVRHRFGQNVSNGEIDGLLEQVVLEHDEPGLDLRRIVHDRVEIGYHLRGRDGARIDIEITRVKSNSWRKGRVQMTGCKLIACAMARTRSSISPKGGAERVGGDAREVLHDLLRPPKLCDDLFVGERCEWRMAPRVHPELVSKHVFRLKYDGLLKDTTSDGEERRLEVVYCSGMSAGSGV